MVCWTPQEEARCFLRLGAYFFDIALAAPPRGAEESSAVAQATRFYSKALHLTDGCLKGEGGGWEGGGGACAADLDAIRKEAVHQLGKLEYLQAVHAPSGAIATPADGSWRSATSLSSRCCNRSPTTALPSGNRGQGSKNQPVVRPVAKSQPARWRGTSPHPAPFQPPAAVKQVC